MFCVDLLHTLRSDNSAALDKQRRNPLFVTTMAAVVKCKIESWILVMVCCKCISRGQCKKSICAKTQKSCIYQLPTI